jgi:hypothetical protein
MRPDEDEIDVSKYGLTRPDKNDTDLGAAARETLEKIESIRTSKGSERSRLVSAIREIADLMMDACFFEAAGWFYRLNDTLGDLDLGRGDPLLAPRKIDTRPPDATRVWLVRAEVAAVAEATLRHYTATRKE